jgi:hypothetical protein
MVAELGLTIIPLDARVARTIQVGDTLNVEVTVKNIWPGMRVLRSYCVMTVDRINELVACRLIGEREV